MYTYFCYGLHVRSELKIPEFLSSSEENPDITIRYGSRPDIELAHDPDAPYAMEQTPGTITVWIPEVGGLQVRKGQEIAFFPMEGTVETGFRFLIAGVGMGLLLHQRDVPSLHGSAVSIDEQAVAFVGWKGTGKSTTASVFHKQGYPVITDDVLPFHFRSDSVRVTPSFPHLKLFPNVLEAVLEEDPDAYLQVDPANEKRSRTARENFPRRRLPLRCIYVLDWGDQDSEFISSRLTGKKACLELLRHSFALRMFKTDGATPEQLNRMSRLAARVPIRTLKRPHDIEKAKRIPSFVKHDLATNARASMNASS